MDEDALDFVFQRDVNEAVNVDAPEMEKEEGVLIEAHADAVHGDRHMLAHQRPVRATADKADLRGRRKQSSFSCEQFLEFLQEIPVDQLVNRLDLAAASLDDGLAFLLGKGADPNVHLVGQLAAALDAGLHPTAADLDVDDRSRAEIAAVPPGGVWTSFCSLPFPCPFSIIPSLDPFSKFLSKIPEPLIFPAAFVFPKNDFS